MSTETAILFVMSDRGLSEILQLGLEKEGYHYQFLTATNNPNALRLFKNSKPDLVLAATELAEDQQLLNKIRRLPAGEDVPFIIICNLYNEELHSELAKQRAHIIYFPFRPKELLSVIQACLADSDTL